jgi:DNA-binding NarL/FixJ family response regulator
MSAIRVDLINGYDTETNFFTQRIGFSDSATRLGSHCHEVGVAIVDREKPLHLPMPAGDEFRSQPQSIADAGALPVQRNPLGPRAYPAGLGTVLVADHRPATRMRLSDALRSNGFIRVLDADSVAELDNVIAAEPAGELALISLEFGPAADRVIGDLVEAGWLRVLATFPFNDSRPVIRAFEAGATGFLRGSPARPAAPNEPLVDRHLSEREIVVIRLVAEGRSNRWIAQQLVVSTPTVKNYLARISRKFGTGDRAHLVAKAMRAGTIQ